MREGVVVGLVGDHSSAVAAHAAIPIAFERASVECDVDVRYEWVPTEEAGRLDRIASFDGLWCVPGSPYKRMAGTLFAIRHAREQRVPFLGTCGGFQHAVIEYAQNVLGWSDAAHGETDPSAARAVISPLSCGLLEGAGPVRFLPGTKLRAAYEGPGVTAEYLCRFGLNPAFRAELVRGPLREAASDEVGDLRAVELDGHPFFVATLFQPERAALLGERVPIVNSFLRAAAAAMLRR